MTSSDSPNLDAVGEAIADARGAEEKLEQKWPNAIQPDDDAYQGMSDASEGGVAERDPHAETDDARQARSPEETVTEQIEDSVVQDEPHRSSDTDPAM